MTSFRIRYTLGSPTAARFPTITYPLRPKPGYASRERAEVVLAAMPDPTRMEVYEEDEG